MAFSEVIKNSFDKLTWGQQDQLLDLNRARCASENIRAYADNLNVFLTKNQIDDAAWRYTRGDYESDMNFWLN